MKKTIEIREKCPSCDGTGLYIGLAERDGAAVVCHNCNGTGCHVFTHIYEDFEKRFDSIKVKRVYATNPGICIGTGNKGELTLKSFGGMPYRDWLVGKPFPPKSENRKYTCPAWWYQSADYKKKPHWPECITLGSFLSCDHFKTKHLCWVKFDKENKG